MNDDNEYYNKHTSTVGRVKDKCIAAYFKVNPPFDYIQMPLEFNQLLGINFINLGCYEPCIMRMYTFNNIMNSIHMYVHRIISDV